MRREIFLNDLEYFENEWKYFANFSFCFQFNSKIQKENIKLRLIRAYTQTENQ